MDFFYTVPLVLAGFLLAISMGWGLAYSLLPADYRRYAPFVAPFTGFVAFCMLAISLSGALGLVTSLAIKVAAGTLLAYSIAVAVATRRTLASSLPEWRELAALAAIMIALSFWSVVDQGTRLYLGTVNPDFSQSLTFLDSLVRFKIAWFIDPSILPGVQDEPFVTAFPVQYQARFGAVAFAQLLSEITQADHRAILMSTILVCLLCLPPAVRFFASAALGMERRTAFVAGALVAISAPIAMSLVHALVGQNSAIASIPIALTLGYLAVVRASTRLWLYFLLIVLSLVFVYVMMAPFIVAPIGAFALYKLARERKRYLLGFLKSMAIVLVVLAAVVAPIAGILAHFFRDLASLVGGIFQSHIYSEYLTEMVIVYGMGISSYPLWSSELARTFSTAFFYLSVGAAVVDLLLYLYALQAWTRRSHLDTVVFVALALVIYLTVGVYYTFVQPYGYSAFKMVSWLNFFTLPFMAYGLVLAWDGVQQRSERLSRSGGVMLLSLLALFYLALNVFASVDYGLKSYGTDVRAGLINSYGVGNNPEWKEIEPALAKYTSPDSVIAVSFPDLLQNNWAAYYAYLAGRSVAYSSHGLFPDDDATLPDIVTGIAVDLKGRLLVDPKPFFKDGRADFYLVPGKGNLNHEIIGPTVRGEPVWENDTVKLIRAADARDMLVSGRGFYRIESYRRDKVRYWVPDRYRWSAGGGEIMHLNPSRPGQPYRLTLNAVVGYGLPEDTRTLEFFHNGRKFDEQRIYAAARLVSAPYYPVAGINRIVVRIKEKSDLMQNKWFSIWNPNIRMEWRHVNIAFSDIRLAAWNAQLPELGKEVGYKFVLDNASSFNGFNVDGWLRNRAQFALARPEGARRLRIRFEIPGIPEYKFPYGITFIIDGKSYPREFAKPGDNIAEFVLEPSSNRELQVEIVPKNFRYMFAAYNQRELIQSVRLDGVTLGRD